jgi:hypothetical protein
MTKPGLDVCYNDKITMVGCTPKFPLDRYFRINGAVCCDENAVGEGWSRFRRNRHLLDDVGMAEHVKEYVGLT